MQLKNICLIFFLLLFCGFHMGIKAQTKLSSQAETLYRTAQYKEAQQLYKNILKQFPSNAIYRHRYGVCLLESHGDINEAKKHLIFSASKDIRLSNYYLAKICALQYEFDSAIRYYNTFKNYIRKSDPRHSEIIKSIAQCERGKAMMNSIEDIKVLDTLVVPFKLFFTHYDLSLETGTFNTTKASEGDSLYLLYLPEKADRNFYSEFRDETQHYDLYKKDKLLDQWSAPKPINSINTTHNELFPFLMSDGLTMYFCSDRPEAFGGYDIFVTRYNPSSNDFLPPQPIGMPFNSLGNDYLYVIDEFRNIGWFASDRHNKPGFVTIYKFQPNNIKKLVESDNLSILRKAALLSDVTSTTDELNPNQANDRTDFDVNENIHKPQKTKDISFEFIINDTTIYHTFETFKNRDALKVFKTYLAATESTDSIQKNISQARIDYGAEKDTKQKKILSELLLTSEAQYLKAKLRSDSLEQRARKLEIDALKAYQKMKKDEGHLSPWQPKPLEIALPKKINPSFYSAYLNSNYSKIFSPYELTLLEESERNKLIADNLVLDWQEILMKINSDPKADRIIIEKLILRDSVFAEPMTPQQLAVISTSLRHQSTEKYIESHTAKYEVLSNKTASILRQNDNADNDQTIKKQIMEAKFQYSLAEQKTENFTQFRHLNLDEIKSAMGHLEKANMVLEDLIANYYQWKMNNKEQSKTLETPSIIYRVQIGIFKNKPNAKAMASIPKVISEPVENSNLVRYFSGKYTDLEQAQHEAMKIEKAGFPGAFVVPFINGVKGDLKDMNSLNKN